MPTREVWITIVAGSRLRMGYTAPAAAREEGPLKSTLHERLETLYRQRNARSFVSPDPLSHVYAFESRADVEMAAVLCAMLAYGRVTQIDHSLTRLLAGIGRPSEYVQRGTQEIGKDLDWFVHRFTRGEDIAHLMTGLARVSSRYGSLEACFAHHDGGQDTLLPALTGFVDELLELCSGSPRFLVPLPSRGGACKRWHLFLRWMVRRDNVDLGLWSRLGQERLTIPLDTHMHRIGLSLGFTRRKSAGLSTARDLTSAFRELSPGDPVRYDFCLARTAMQEPDRLRQVLQDDSRHRG